MGIWETVVIQETLNKFEQTHEVYKGIAWCSPATWTCFKADAWCNLTGVSSLVLAGSKDTGGVAGSKLKPNVWVEEKSCIQITNIWGYIYTASTISVGRNVNMYLTGHSVTYTQRPSIVFDTPHPTEPKTFPKR